MIPHNLIAHNRFSDELAAIINTSDQLLQRLKEHEASLFSAPWPGNEPRKQPGVKSVDQNRVLWDACSPLTHDDSPSLPMTVPPVLQAKHAWRDDERKPEGDAPTLPLTVPGWVADEATEEGLTQSNINGGTSTKRALELRGPWVEVNTSAQQEVMRFYESCFQQVSGDDKCIYIAQLSEKSTHSKRRSRNFMVASLTSEKEVKKCLRDIRSCQILHPAGQMRAMWNLITLILIAIDMLTIPLMAFEVGNSLPWEILAWFATFFWTADVCMSFRTGYYVGVKVEMRPTKIAIQYAKTWLVLDAFIVFFEWFSRFFNSLASASVVRATRTVRTVRLVKLMRIAKMKELMIEFAERINSNVAYLVLRIFFLTAVLCVIAHYVTCAWYAIGCNRHDGWTSYDMYSMREDSEAALGFTYWYVSSARWVISQLNGRTDMDERRNMPERVFTVMGGVLFAIVGQAIFISMITKAMIELSNLFKEQHTRRRTVNEFLSLQSLPYQVERSVKTHAKEYKDMSIETKKEQLVLSLLPKHLQTELLYEIRKPYVMNHPLFGIILEEFVTSARRLCQNVFKMHHAVTGEVVFDIKDVCTRMLIMVTGCSTYGPPGASKASGLKIQLVKEKANAFAQKVKQLPKVVQNLTRGKWVSEAALWVAWKNRGRLTTESNCCMLDVDEKLFARVLHGELHAFGFCAVYAKHFVAFLNEQDVLSDTVTFDSIDIASIFDGSLSMPSSHMNLTSVESC